MKNFAKKFVLGFLLASIIMPVQATNAGSFSDVASGHVNYDAIEYLKGKDIISGYEDGTFGPDKSINRAEATKIIDKAFNINTTKEHEEVFPDVPKSSWFFPFVMAGKEAGFIKGYADGKFQPAKQVKLSETLKMVLSAGGATLPLDTKSDVFADVQRYSWVAPYAFYAREHNIVLADIEGKISPATEMTRGNFAEIIYRTMTVIENDGKVFPLDKNWATFESADMPFSMKYDANDWKIIKNKHDVVFSDSDETLSQFSPTRVYPNSARVEITIDKNDEKMTDAQYFANIKIAFPDAKYTEFKWNNFKALEVLYPEKKIVDWYIYLPSEYVMVVYTEYGNGPESYRFPRVIQGMLSTLNYKDMQISFVDDYADILDQIFKNILIEGKGMEMLNLLPDKKIIETDAIGVGTGPVDYYYSEGVDYTFKYERKTDVILDKRQGNTSAF